MRANGEKPITLSAIGKEWGCTQQNVSKRLKSPQRLNPYEVGTLCDMLRVSPDCLQYGGENGYGRYESTDFMADVIDRLDPEGRETVWRVIVAVADEDTLKDVEDARWQQTQIEWARRHPEEMKQFGDRMRDLRESLNKSISALNASFANITTMHSDMLKQIADIATSGIRRELTSDYGKLLSTRVVPPEQTEHLRKVLDIMGQGKTESAE